MFVPFERKEQLFCRTWQREYIFSVFSVVNIYSKYCLFSYFNFLEQYVGHNFHLLWGSLWVRMERA